jgi:hypothetical protein
MDQDNGAEKETTDQTNASRRRQKPTCPHYQQLSTMRTARQTQSRFIVNTQKVSCCSSVSGGGGGGGGGEQTKLGVHDIEDLLTFGKNTLILIDEGTAVRLILTPETTTRTGGWDTLTHIESWFD